MGKWSFGYLMQQIANAPVTGVSPEDFTLNCVDVGTQKQVNGWTLHAPQIAAPDPPHPWLHASGGQKLDLSKAPFKLLAIVNRVDLPQAARPDGRRRSPLRLRHARPRHDPQRDGHLRVRRDRVDDVDLQAWGAQVVRP